MPNEQMPASHGSLFLSALGWIVAVLAIAGLLFIGKPRVYTAGYEQGKKDQYDHDVAQVQEFMKASVDDDGETTPIFGRVVSINNNSFQFEYLQNRYSNPLTTQNKQVSILVDDKTTFVKRTLLSKEEYDAKVKKTASQGGNPLMVAPYNEQSITFQDIKPADEVYIMVTHREDGTRLARSIEMNINLDPAMVAPGH